MSTGWGAYILAFALSVLECSALPLKLGELSWLLRPVPRFAPGAAVSDTACTSGHP